MRDVSREIGFDLTSPSGLTADLMSHIRIKLSIIGPRWTIFFSVRRDMVKESGR